MPVVGYTITNYVNHPDRLFSQRVTLPQYCIIGAYSDVTAVQSRLFSDLLALGMAQQVARCLCGCCFCTLRGGHVLGLAKACETRCFTSAGNTH